jgi:hypothetical protein
MKTRGISCLLLGVCFTGIFIFSGCKKENNNDANLPTLTFSAQDDITVSNLLEVTFSDVEEALVDVSTLKSTTIDCKKVNYIGLDSTGFFQVYNIDFGDSCIRSDGLLKSGTIIVKTVDANTYWNSKGLKRIITFNNFKIEGISIQGVDNLFYNGKDSLGRPLYTEILDTAIIRMTDGTKISFSYFRNKIWVAGYDDQATRMNDIFYVSGLGEGVNRKGNTFFDSIPANNPLFWLSPTICRWVQSGKEYIIYQKDTAFIDYFGNRNCTIGTTGANLILKNGSKNPLRIYP